MIGPDYTNDGRPSPPGGKSAAVARYWIPAAGQIYSYQNQYRSYIQIWNMSTTKTIYVSFLTYMNSTTPATTPDSIPIYPRGSTDGENTLLLTIPFSQLSFIMHDGSGNAEVRIAEW